MKAWEKLVEMHIKKTYEFEKWREERLLNIFKKINGKAPFGKVVKLKIIRKKP